MYCENVHTFLTNIWPVPELQEGKIFTMLTDFPFMISEKNPKLVDSCWFWNRTIVFLHQSFHLTFSENKYKKKHGNPIATLQKFP